MEFSGKSFITRLGNVILLKRKSSPRRSAISLLVALKAIGICLIVSFGLTFLHSIGWFNEDTNRLIDIFSAVDRFLSPTPRPTNILVVLVTDRDFQKYYQNKNYSGFIDRNYLAKLIRKIAVCQPAVIAVDFDLSFRGENADSLIQALRSILATVAHPKIVLSSTLTTSLLIPGKSVEILPPYCDAVHSSLRFGFNNIDACKARFMLLSIEGTDDTHLSFAATIAGVKDDVFLKDLATEVLHKKTILRARFHRPDRFQTRRSSYYLENSNSPALADTIVIIGGSYWAANDEHVTPTGVMSGAEVHANLVDNLLNKLYVRVPSLPSILFIQIGFGLFIAFLFLRYPLTISIKLVSIAGAILLMAISWWLFRTTAYWLSALPAATVTGWYIRRRAQNYA